MPPRKAKRFSPRLLELAFDQGREDERRRNVRMAQRRYAWHRIAAAVGVDPATVRNWRSGITAPSADQYLALVHYLDMEPGDLAE